MPGVTSDLIGARMAALGRPPEWRGGVSALAPVLAGALREGDLVVTMGAGDVTHVGPAVLAARGARAS
jgi:UDP-N-acetylmuramate--alanine ligase